MATSAKIFRINYKSDFILTLTSDAGWMTPFCIKFWTGAPSQAYYVGWDGTTYDHCSFDPSEPTKLQVQFDDHHLPIGDLKFQVAYHFTVADFPDDTEDEVLNQANITTEIDGETYQVMLDFTGETAPEIQFALPAYANEAQRIANEQQRIAAETIRIQNEESRIAAEQTRQQNEQQRINQETARVNEYAGLKADAVAATDAANAAANLANQKAQLAADKAALAQSAADLATAKAQLAADKAALAASAAQLANDKAALAQQKAEYALAQGDYAKDQGDYAKAQGDTALADHQRAEADHEIAADDHTQAGNDHTRAESDHGIAVDDHTQAGNDHTRAESDHGIAVDDHTQAGTDHQTASADHQTAAADHTQAGNDHTRAESDHTRAESDHDAVELYVDSLGVFDLSKHNAVGGVLATYADLSAALTALNALESKYKYGGMSFKFVSSVDNKYVQYRYIPSDATTVATFTNVANWQGVDEEPKAKSKNLIESGGVYPFAFNTTELASKIKPSKYNDTFYIVDLNGYILAKIDNSGVHAKNIQNIENVVNNIGGVLEIINPSFSKELYITDNDGNIIAKFNEEGLVVPSIKTSVIKTLDGKGNHAQYSNYELFVLGDSLSSNGRWANETARILGCTFSQEKNSAAGNQLSTGGTFTGGDGFDNAIWRCKHLVDSGYISGKGENAIVVLENVNDYLSAGFDKTVNALVPTDPIEGDYQFSNWGVSLLQSVPAADRKMNAVLKLLDVSAGKNLAITALPSSSGAVTITFVIGGQTLNYNIQVESTDSLSTILGKILEYNYTMVTDTLAEDGESVDFVGHTTITSLTFTDTDNTGMTVSITDTDSAKIDKAAYFIGNSVSDDWEDTSKWLMGSDLTVSIGYKTVIELLQRTYPQLHIMVAVFPIHAVTASEFLLPNGTYDSASYYNAPRMVNARNKEEVLKDIADFYSIPCLDVFGECGIGISNMLEYYNSVANVHPKTEGYLRFGQTVASLIKRHLV